VNAGEHSHDPAAIRRRIAAPPRPSYLRDWVYGGIDGAVTTFAVVSGVTGADLTVRVILILGVANLLADGFSMAAGNYLATSTEREQLAQLAAIERRHIEVEPAGERAEVREIYRRKGLAGEPLEHVVEAITADRERWIDTMLAHEYGVARELRRPWPAALGTFASFALCGAVPLLPFLLGSGRAFALAGGLTGLVFFGIGALKSLWSTRTWWRSGLETLAVGAAAAGLAYGAGILIAAALGG
jgi:VIT1/CCC1 family predicted Fe2+/Mn2+ transporter